MENIELSANVKKYFIHALKSLGFPRLSDDGNNFQEMTEAEISAFLDDPKHTINDIYVGIKVALVQQIQRDANGENFIKNHTAYDRATLKRVLMRLNVAGNFKFDAAQSEHFLRSLTASGVESDGTATTINGAATYSVAEAVITAMMKGVVDQKMSSGERNEATNLWKQIMTVEFQEFLSKRNAYNETEFKAWLKDKKSSQRYTVYYEQYRIYQMRHKLIAEIAQYCNPKMACGLIDMKIKDVSVLQQLQANESLFNEGQKYFKKRCEIEGKDATKETMTLGDVLAVAGNEKAQIVTFFQTRSIEQNEQKKQNSQAFESTKENQIGNVLGEQGRKYITERTGSGAVIDYDIIKGLKSGKKGPWRGLKPLFERISRFLSQEIYGSIQSVGLTQSIIEREDGYVFTPDAVKSSDEESREQELVSPKKPQVKKPNIHTDFQTIPAEYRDMNGKLNTAGKFYNKLKTRIMLDQTLQSKIALEVQKRGISVQDDKDAKARINYLQDRINTAMFVLSRKMPAADSKNFNDETYYAKLEQQIVKREEYKNINSLKDLLTDKAINASADEMMTEALENIAKVSTVQTKAGIQVKSELAKNIFNLNGMVAEQQVSGEDLAGMVDRFLESDEYRRSVYYLKENTLPIRTRDQQKITSVDVMLRMNKFAIEDLQQNVCKDQIEAYEAAKQNMEAEYQQAYARYQKELNTRQARDAIKQNRTEIMQEVADELNGGRTM